MKISEITSAIELFAPLALQENYDNSGIQLGNLQSETESALICIDVTEEVIDEAIALNSKLIISHHPLIFKGLKSITGKDYIERCVVKAIKNDITIYTAHTNLDNAWGGVSFKMAEKLGLTNVCVLSELSDSLLKLITFVPNKNLEKVRNSLFEAGAGHIGNYDQCSYQSEGYGTFRAGEGSTPFCGEINELHSENEIRLEVILPVNLKSKAIKALYDSHPYEEPAFDLIPLMNDFARAGAGVVGELPESMTEIDFLKKIKIDFKVEGLKFSPLLNKSVRKIALCGGSGAFLIGNALRASADAYITGDIKYHDFFNHNESILLVDAGHYESEQYTIELICEIIQKKFATFAVHFTKCKTNQINYL
ncbi:MAG: Nif3-like dinuclear metal center hexameric protein [Bacteroidales bacterium]|nr:Nif3-like dinuclear metal center hexameric protein [Bacteroidales bacterium]